MSEAKKLHPAKGEFDLSPIFQEKETEAAFVEWWKANTKKLDTFEKSTSKDLLFALAEFWYERVNNAWNDTIDVVHRQSDLLNKMQNAIPAAFKHGEFSALLKERDKLLAHESRIIGGEKRGKQLAKQKKDKHKAIEEKEKELAPKFASHKLNKEIAKALELETGYVLKARNEIKKKKSADS